MAFCADFGSRCVQRISDFPAAVFLADEHEDGLESARRVVSQRDELRGFCGFSLPTCSELVGLGEFRLEPTRWGLGSVAHAETSVQGHSQGVRTLTDNAKCL